MSEILSRFTYQETKMTSQIWVSAAVLWLIVVISAVSSILAQPFSKRQRTIWLAIVIGVPIFGLLAYLPFSIRRDELPTAFLMRGSAKDKKRGGGGRRGLPPPRT